MHTKAEAQPSPWHMQILFALCEMYTNSPSLCWILAHSQPLKHIHQTLCIYIRLNNTPIPKTEYSCDPDWCAHLHNITDVISRQLAYLPPWQYNHVRVLTEEEDGVRRIVVVVLGSRSVYVCMCFKKACVTRVIHTFRGVFTFRLQSPGSVLDCDCGSFLGNVIYNRIGIGNETRFLL